jgi:hypothetical protein
MRNDEGVAYIVAPCKSITPWLLDAAEFSVSGFPVFRLQGVGHTPIAAPSPSP